MHQRFHTKCHELRGQSGALHFRIPSSERHEIELARLLLIFIAWKKRIDNCPLRTIYSLTIKIHCHHFFYHNCPQLISPFQLHSSNTFIWYIPPSTGPSELGTQQQHLKRRMGALLGGCVLTNVAITRTVNAHPHIY